MKILLNKRILLFVTLILIIFFILAAIYYIDSQKQTYAPQGFDNLKQGFQKLITNEETANNPAYKRAQRMLTEFENQKLTKAQQLEKIILIDNAIYQAYAETNDHEIYNFYAEFKKFVDTNYANLGYKVNIQCQDPACAEQPIPKEISTIIDDVNNSAINENLKIETVLQLKNFSYLNEKDAEVKALQYLGLASSIKSEEEFVKVGNNLKIYEEIKEFVQKNYPDYYNKYAEQIQ